MERGMFPRFVITVLFALVTCSVAHLQKRIECCENEKTVASFLVHPNLTLVEAKNMMVPREPSRDKDLPLHKAAAEELSQCLGMCQSDDLCTCMGVYSVDSSGFLHGPGCFHSSQPCQTTSADDSMVYTKATAACLTCPAGAPSLAKPGANGTCICDVAGTFPGFVKSLTCSESASGLFQTQDQMPVGMPMQQTSEHCAAVAIAQVAPVFCVTVPSGKCAIYFPENTSQMCGPSHDDVQCFEPMLKCQPCSTPVRILASEKDGWNFDLRGDGKVHHLDNAGWSWVSPVTPEDMCSAKCWEGHLLARRADVAYDGYQYIVHGYQYRCFDRRIFDAWITTYTLLCLYGVGVTVFLVWQLHFRCNTRCACGVGWVHQCSEHEKAFSSTEDMLNCLNCHCDAGLLCENPDTQQPAREWGLRTFFLQMPIVAMLVVLRQWDRLFMGGQSPYLYDLQAENSSAVNFWFMTAVVFYVVPGMIQILLFQLLRPIYVYSSLFMCGQFVMYLSFHASFLTFSANLIYIGPTILLYAMSSMILVGALLFVGVVTHKQPFPWMMRTSQRTVRYRLQCCGCARGVKKLCNLCKHRQDHSALCGRGTLATVQYTQDYLVHHAPWDTRSGEVQGSMTKLKALCFRPDFFDHRREFSYNKKMHITACCAVTQLLGSVCYNSGERTYYEVKILEVGGVMRLGWQGGGSTWLFDVVRQQFLHLQAIRGEVTVTDRVYIRLDSAHHVDTSKQLASIVKCGQEHGLCGYEGTYGVRVDGTNLDQRNSSNDLLHVVAEETWNIQVSKGDVIGLACDLQDGKIHVSRNGNWSSQSMTIGLNKNTRGKFDTMRPYMELEGIKVERDCVSTFQYNGDTDKDGEVRVVLLRRRQVSETNMCIPGPVHNELAPFTHQEYAVSEGSPELPPGLSLDSVTGEISGAWEPAEPEMFDCCSQVQIETMDLWGRKRYAKVRLHLYLREHLYYPSAYAVVSSSQSLNLPTKDTCITETEDTQHSTFKGCGGRMFFAMKGVKIFIPAQLVLGYPRSAECRVNKLLLPEGLDIDCVTGDLSGVPMQSGDFELTIEACNSGSSCSCTFQLNISDPDFPSGFRYPLHRPDRRFHPGHQYEIGERVQILPESLPQCAPGYHGQFDFSIHPNLPDGWQVDPETGAIKGVAKEKLHTTQFVVTALRHMGADCCAIVRIKVAVKVESVHLPLELKVIDGQEHHFEAGKSLLLETKLTGTGSDVIFCATYSCRPSLPEGLAFDEDGNVWGIPHELQPIIGKIYSIKAAYGIYAEKGQQFSKSVAKISLTITEPFESLKSTDVIHLSRRTGPIASSAHDSEVPQVVGYMIKSRLGNGGQGDVWLATRNGTDTYVAIKWYPEEDVGGREAENLNALTKLQHPNVVQFIDCTNRALVMEHIQGLTLKVHLNYTNRHALPWDEASVITRGLLAGLGCLHSMKPPLLHRDVSTANVMLRVAPVTDTQQVVLVDFGLSKRTGKTATQTKTVGQIFLGTAAYLAPEVGRVESKDLDARIDVWAAGVILYEMLAGQRPWTAPAGEDMMLIHKISQEKHKRISKAEFGVNAFLNRALEKDKVQRFSDAIEMLDVFEQVCKNPGEIPAILHNMQTSIGKPRIAAFFVKRRNDTIDVHKEAQTFTDYFANSSSSFELDIHAQPLFHAFSDALLESRQRNIRILHFAGHGQDRCGFMWLKDREAREYDKNTRMDDFVACFKTEAHGRYKGGTIECVVLNACETEAVGKKLRGHGVPHVVCWRSEVRDETAHNFSNTFYKALARQSSKSPFDYHLAFDQAVSRMTSGEGDSRKPARHKAEGAVDFLCMLSVNGDVKFKDAVASCKSRNEEREKKKENREEEMKGMEDQHIMMEDMEHPIKQIQREEEDFHKMAVGLKVEETDESVIVVIGPEYMEPGMSHAQVQVIIEEHDEIHEENEDEESPTSNWRSQTGKLDQGALAGKHERDALTWLGFEMKLHGKEIQVGHGIKPNGCLEKIVLSQWKVQAYPQLWGEYGKAVDKARQGIDQKQRQSVEKSVNCLLSALVERKADMENHAVKRICNGECTSEVCLGCKEMRRLYFGCHICKLLNCIYCTNRKEHEHMEKLIRATMLTIGDLL